MRTGYVLDPIFGEHEAPHPHPECPARIAAVARIIAHRGFDKRAMRLPIREAQEHELARVHGPSYLAHLERTLPGACGWLDDDTFYSKGTWPAVLAAAAAGVDLSEAVLDGRFQRGVALVRPPGHHAEADRAMGFCMLNNVAVAAAMARQGGARVSILDWDVHHGNGTQHIFESDPLVQYISIHQYPHYPGTGAPDEVGQGAGLGTTVNLAMPAGCGDSEYLAAFDQVIDPEVEGFKPDLVLLSAGFDAFSGDPLAGMRVTIDGFRALSRRLVGLSERVCSGKLVAVLEGGYDLAGLGQSVAALLEVMMNEDDTSAEQACVSEVRADALAAIQATQKSLSRARGLST